MSEATILEWMRRLDEGQREILATLSQLQGADLPARVTALESGPNPAVRRHDCEALHGSMSAWGRLAAAAVLSAGLTFLAGCAILALQGKL